MRTIFSNVVIVLIVLVLGCKRDNEFPASLRLGLEIVSERIRNPTVDPVHYANNLLSEIVALPKAEDRFACQREWENLIYKVEVDSQDLHVRYDQVVAFCDISSVASCCILKIGGTEEDYWESRIRLLKWMQDLLSRLEPPTLPVLIAQNDHRPRTEEERLKDSYWEMVHAAVDMRVRLMEQSFNDRTCSQVSPERQQRMRRKMELVLGRQIRTNKEIDEQIRSARKLKREQLGF